MPTKKQIITIGVLCVISLGLGYWYGMPKEGSGGGGGGKGRSKEPEFLKQGLVAYYPFNGNAKDESGNRNDGEVKGAALTDDRHGKLNSAYQFNGGSDIISFSGGLLLDESKTVSVWVRTADFTRPGGWVRRLFSNRSSTDNPFTLTAADTDRPGFVFAIGPRDHGSDNGRQLIAEFVADDETAPTITGQWVHIVGSYDDATRVIRIFVNGLGRSSNGTGYRTSKSHVLAIGNWPELNLGIVGRMDDIRIYNRALSEAEVKELYEFEKPKTQQASTAKLKEKITGTYERKEGAITERLVSLDNGAMEHYVNGGKTSTEWKWSLVDKEIHLDRGGRTSTLAYRINPDDSITAIASITNGKRTDLPNKGQLTYIKIK